MPLDHERKPGKYSPSRLGRLTVKGTYAPPQVRRLTSEQGTLFLVGHAWYGEKNARDLLDLLFPEPRHQAP